MIVYLAGAIQAFVMYCVNGTSRSSLLIESVDSMIYITSEMRGVKHMVLMVTESDPMATYHFTDCVHWHKMKINVSLYIKLLL